MDSLLNLLYVLILVCINVCVCNIIILLIYIIYIFNIIKRRKKFNSEYVNFKSSFKNSISILKVINKYIYAKIKIINIK